MNQTVPFGRTKPQDFRLTPDAAQTEALEPRIVTHLGNRSAGFPTHHHGALYCPTAECMVQLCPHNHETVDAAIICSHQMKQKPLPSTR